MSTAGVFMDIDKALHITQHFGVPYKLSQLKFSTSLIKINSSFHPCRKFRVSVWGEISTPKDVRARMPQSSVVSPTLCSICIRHLYIYATDRKEGYVLRKLQRGLSAIETWYERWNIKIKEGKTLAIYFSHRVRPPEVHLILNGRNIPYVNCVKYLGVIFERRITWRLNIEMIESKAFRTFIRICFLFKSERLSSKIKLNLHKILIASIIIYACPAWELAAT
jgi:hypothetical protein